jgi:hypothetical protein
LFLPCDANQEFELLCLLLFLDVPPQPEPQVPEPATQPQEEEGTIELEVYNPPSDAQEPVVEETPAPEVIDVMPNSAAVAAPSSTPPVPVEEAPKKSYASIVSFNRLTAVLLYCINYVERQGFYSNRGYVCKC